MAIVITLRPMMADIASQLHPKVMERHMKRLESGAQSDVQEMRYIFSDWQMYELYRLQKLASFVKLSTVVPSLKTEKSIFLEFWTIYFGLCNRHESMFTCLYMLRFDRNTSDGPA